MATIRPLERRDIPQVVSLRRKCFAQSEHHSEESLGNYIEQVFLKNPWSRHGTDAVVCEAKDGRIVGFHGRFRKRMIFGRTEAVLLAGTQLMVDPEAGGFLGIQMLQQLFHGDHDLFLADAGNDASRRMWEALNGDVLHVQSLTWTMPIQHHYHLRHLGRSLPARAARFLARRALDAYPRTASVGPKVRGMHEVTFSRVALLTPETMALKLRDVAGKKTVVPRYEPEELRWIFDRIEEGGVDEVPVSRIVEGFGNRTLGWFVYVPRSGDVGRVLGVVAQDDAYGAVLDALAADASARGCDAVQGRVEPKFFNELGERGCELSRSGPWLLVQSRRPDILDAVRRGDMKLTLLDGERWLRF
jgi:hypothetical protein